MNIFRSKITVSVVLLALVAVLGVPMTQPQPTPNDLDLGLPAAVQGVVESPVVMRIGTVADITEAQNITVKISGSPTLVQASYLFPQYEPLLGDRVVVYRQDSQWFVMGTMSGPINTVLPNPSFEEGVDGALPPGWSLNITGAAAGNPVFIKTVASQYAMTGTAVGNFGLDSVAGGTSSAEVFSTSIPATPGSLWTLAYFITYARVDQSNVNNSSGGRASFVDMTIQFLDSGGVVLATEIRNVTLINGDEHSILYRRPGSAGLASIAPAGTAFVRFRLNGSFTVGPNSFTSFLIDDVVLRRVG